MDKVIYIELNGVPGLKDFSFQAVAPTINFANVFDYLVATETFSPLIDRNVSVTAHLLSLYYARL